MGNEGFNNSYKKEQPKHVEGEIFPPGEETPQEMREREAQQVHTFKSFEETLKIQEYMSNPEKLAQDIADSITGLEEAVGYPVVERPMKDVTPQPLRIEKKESD